MPSAIQLGLVAFAAMVASALAESRKSATAAASVDTPIALSGDVATGIFLGFGLIGMLFFAVTMLMQIEASDKLAVPKGEGR